MSRLDMVDVRSDSLDWRRVTVAPGNVYYILRTPAAVVTGGELPAGTKVRPISGGWSNSHNCNVATLSVVEVSA
ncbi:MAG TPA: hypothetical protein VGK73_30335 [Polyangiaceae bacterium]